MSWKTIAFIDINSSDEFEQNKLKQSWKGFTILDSFKNIHDSWEEMKTSILTGVWKKLIPTFIEFLWMIQDIHGGSNCTCGGNSEKTRSKVCRCNGTAAISKNRWEDASYEWEKKITSWNKQLYINIKFHSLD